MSPNCSRRTGGIESERRRRIGEAIVEGYKRIPQTEEELAWAADGAAAMIAEEPW